MGAAILYTGICQIESGKLRVWVLVSDATLQTAHSFFGLYSLTPDDIADLEIQGHILQRAAGSPFDLRIELGVGTATEPRCHGRVVGSSRG
jgi:hypothetical protein